MLEEPRPHNPYRFCRFCAARALSTCNDQPEKASRPFDKRRDGFVMGEGAGVLVMETLEHALKRNAFIYGEIAGYGMSGDGYHVTAPDPEGWSRLCMERALKDASLLPSEVGYINAHGTSTEYNDRIETKAIKKFSENTLTTFPSAQPNLWSGTVGSRRRVEAVATFKYAEWNHSSTINYEYEIRV